MLRRRRVDAQAPGLFYYKSSGLFKLKHTLLEYTPRGRRPSSRLSRRLGGRDNWLRCGDTAAHHRCKCVFSKSGRVITTPSSISGLKHF
ncbi:hypothetical protein EVAR_15735_1 [Eumeta japonica]|uniref:Uncharacterized protein n=1 Tax=Eumeta variegata TaxID=151549 RepID=A0A4C1UAC4_EUMVA|nr:hypothetical protein EVAR_15735_1 [Eumeta japonica]